MPPPGKAGSLEDRRLTFQEVMRMVSLPDQQGPGGIIKRYMSQRAAWNVISDVAFASNMSAFGGHVYCQAGLAASKAFSEKRAKLPSVSGREFSIHTIHGYFSEAGLCDRPYIYEVTPVAENLGFYNVLVTVRQPTVPSTNQAHDHFPLSDAELPLGPVCFSALVSFRPATVSELSAQETPVQARFADVLNSRKPSEWDPSPPIDIASIVAVLPRDLVGTFPAVDIKKVDMTSYNKGKPLHERRELLLYRLLAPLPDSDPDLHILVHAYEADRNGLLMIVNHMGIGFNFGRAASLSYSFVVHVNPSDAVMKFGEDQWWVQEACFPRVKAGRGIVMSKIWSPEGVHVATEYQDGIVRPAPQPGDRKGKL
ncbi:hypothetical protein SLS62_008590 [Diatrype stigma]|uniref:Acyl-CoA thioesterase-like C-terminal domain-containing protein n=1 Tax=Diatrype stigma TaxID=117547 RepID=A0AAN9UHG7_9PEZI